MNCKNVLGDSMLTPVLRDAEIALCDELKKVTEEAGYPVF